MHVVEERNMNCQKNIAHYKQIAHDELRNLDRCSFIRSFLECFIRADEENKVCMLPCMAALATKYNLKTDDQRNLEKPE